jgi:hypothetical protein
MDAMTLHYPQECSTMKNETDVQRILNSLNTPNDVLKETKETITHDSGVISGQGSECKVIHNNCRYKEINSKDSEISSLKLHPTKCSKTPVSYVCKKSKASKYRRTVRKGTQHSFSNSNPVFNYTIRYVKKKRKTQHADFSGSYDRDDKNHATNTPRTETALEDTTNNSMGTDYDIDAILKEYKIVPPISNFDDTCVLSVNLHSTENNSSHERNRFIISTDVETEVQEADDVCNYDKDDVQFGSDAGGALIPFAAYEDGPSSMCPKTTDNLTLRSKQINFTCHTKECNLSEKYVNDDGKAVITHHSVQDTCGHSVDAWPWTDLFPPGNDDGIQFPTWEECMYVYNTLTNNTVNESTALAYTNSQVPRDVMSDNIHTYVDKPEQFWNYVLNCTEPSTINSLENSVSKNIQGNNKQNNSVEDYQKKGNVDVDFPERLSFLQNNQYTIL